MPQKRTFTTDEEKAAHAFTVKQRRAERQRLRRQKMNEEERARAREIGAEHQRLRRQKMNEEERARAREINTERSRNRRQQFSEEERARNRQRNTQSARNRYRARRSLAFPSQGQTLDDKECRQELIQDILDVSRSSSNDDDDWDGEIGAEHQSLRRQKMNEEERARAREINTERSRNRRQQLSEEERARNRQRNAQSARNRYRARRSLAFPSQGQTLDDKECRQELIQDILDVSRSSSDDDDDGDGDGDEDWTSEDEDPSSPLTEEESRSDPKRKITFRAERVRQYRANLPKERLEQIKDIGRLRTRKKRANMTPAEKEMDREKARIRARQARAKLTGKLRLNMLKRHADATRLRRKATQNEPFPAEKATTDNVIPGETYGDRKRRLNRQQKAKRRRDLGSQMLEVLAKEKGRNRIVAWIDRKLLTLDEKNVKREQEKQNNKKLKEQGCEPEVEDDIAWRNYFLYYMKLEFLTRRNKLAEEALEIELGTNVPLQESPLLNPNWSAVEPGTQQYNLSKKSLRGSNVGKNRILSTDGTSNERETVHNRWKGVVDNDSDDEECNAILHAFNQVQIKIEADELYEQLNELGESNTQDGVENQSNSEIADWIARVITGEEGNNEQVGTSNASRQSIHTVEPRTSYTQSARSKAAEKFQDIISAPSRQEKVRMLGHWRQLAVRTAQEEKRDELHRFFLAARQCWVDKKPEDTEKRVKIDEERIAVKERVRSQKTEAIELIIPQLIHKRDVFSRETHTARESRIVKYYESVVAHLLESNERRKKIENMTEAEKEEKRQQKIRLSVNLTKEEMRAYNAANCRLRNKMEKAEYDLHLALLAATGFTIPPPKFETRSKKDKAGDTSRTLTYASGIDNGATGASAISVEDFENAFRVDIYAQCIEFWDKTVHRTRTEVITYRNLMLEYLSKRRKKVDLLANSRPTNEPVQSTSSSVINVATDSFLQIEGRSRSECRYEWISLPESKSFEDIERFQYFIKNYGEPVINHFTYKRFYLRERQQFTINKLSSSKEQLEQRRIRFNEVMRRRYIRKKYGIILGEGEYFDKKTMSAVKKPPKVYPAWERKRQWTGQAVVSEQNPIVPRPKSTTRPKSTVRKKRKTITTPVVSPTRARRDARVSQAQPQPIDTVSTSNSNDNVDYSNSSDGFADSGPAQEDEDSGDGFVPLGSFEMDSVIRNDILNLPTPGLGENQQQNFQFSQSHHTASGMGMQLRSGDLPHIQQSQQSYQHLVQTQYHHQYPQMPRLQLVDQFTNQFTNQMDTNYNSQMQWNPNASGGISEPLNYSLQFLPNSQISLLQSQQYPSSQLSSNPQTYPWNSASSSTMMNPTTSYLRNEMPHLQPQLPVFQFQHDTPTPTSSVAAETLSVASAASEVEVPSSPPDICSPQQKRPRGRPKGWKMTSSSKTSQQAIRRTFNSGPKRDIWSNRKRRKYYINSTPDPQARIGVTNKFESPFERNPEQMRDSMLMENISNLLPKCPQCDKIVDDDAALKAHMSLQHPDPNQKAEDVVDVGPSKKRWREYKVKVACEVCSEQFEGPANLIDHLFTVHFETKLYKCPFGCIRFNSNRNRLRDHIVQRHANEAKASWVIGINGLKTMAGKIKFWCLNCEKCYNTYSDLKNHCKETHEKIRYCCVHCGIYLRMENHWTDHAKLFHSEKPIRDCPLPVEVDEQDLFRCIECHSEFSAQSFLDEHEAKGHSLIEDCDDNSKKRRPFTCRVCDKRYETEERRDDHFKTCKDRNLECYWCKYKAESASLVQSHINEFHSQEPPVPENREDYSYSHEPYKCEICKKSYMSLYSLRLHCMYNHQLHKYCQSVKEKNLMNPPKDNKAVPEENKAVPQDNKAVPEDNKAVPEDNKALPKETITKSKSDQLKSMGKPDPTTISCSICQTTNHNLHQTHKAFDKLMRRYCAQCDRLFSRNNVLRQHNEAAHSILPEQMEYLPPSGRIGKFLPTEDPSEWVTCNCGRSFTNQEFHQHHLFFEKDTDVRICVHCNKKFFNSPSYLRHIHDDHGVPINEKMVVSNKKLEKIQKRELVQEDYDKLSSSTVVKTATGEMTIFSCKVCLKNFKALQFLHAHIGEAHREDAFTRVVCKTCNCTFASMNNLKKHERYHHQNLYKLLCPICDQSISRMYHLRDHMKKFHPEKPFNVADVKKVPFEEAVQAAKSFVCKICSSDFVTELGMRSHITTKHFPTHWSTFCEFCGLQMNPKTIKHHVAAYHQAYKDDVVVRPIRRNKEHLSLPEVVELVQALYDKFRINSSKPRKLKKKTSTKSQTSKKQPKMRKTQKASYSEEEISLGETDSEASEVSIFSSDDEDEETVNVGYGEEESDKEESYSNKTLSKYDKGSTSQMKVQSKCNKSVVKSASRKRIIKSKTGKRIHEEVDSESESESESTYIKCSTGTRSRPAQKKLANLESNSEHPPPKSRICRTRKKITLSPDSDDANYEKDDGSDSDFAPVETIPKRPSTQKPASTRKSGSKNARSNRVSTPVASSKSSSSTVILEQFKRLVICLERCDKDIKWSATSSAQPACYKPSPKPMQAVGQLPTHEQEMSSDIHVAFVLVKDEIDDIGPDQDQDKDDVNNINLHGLLEPNSPLTTTSQWQYVDINTVEDDDEDQDDQDELDSMDSDPLSGIHPGCL